MSLRSSLVAGLAVLAFGLETAACAGPRQELNAGEVNPESDGFVLALENRHWLDVNIFVQHDGEPSRVGMVTASSSRSMVLPRWLLGDAGVIRIIAEPVGANDRYTTESVRVEPGQTIELTIESQLSKSYYRVE